MDVDQLRVTLEARIDESKRDMEAAIAHGDITDGAYEQGKAVAFGYVLGLLPSEPAAWTTDNEGQPF